MTYVLIYVAIVVALVLWFVIFGLKRVPLDTDIWGPEVALMDIDPETRAEILRRHPELRDIILSEESSAKSEK